MSDYIKRSQVTDILIDERRLYGKGMLEKAINAVCDIPAADVTEVRHGVWVLIDGMPCCNRCGLLPEHPTRYCPNCGAKMDL